MDVVKLRLVQLLKDKENSVSIPEQAGGWLTNDVPAVDTVAKAGGTFR